MEIKKIKSNQENTFLNNLEKAYTEGIYADTPQNRKLGRVGMSYADYSAKVKKQEEGGEKKEKPQVESSKPKEENSIKINMNFDDSASDMPISTDEGINGNFTLNQFKGDGKYKALSLVETCMKNIQSSINSLMKGNKELIEDNSQISLFLNRQDKDDPIEIEPEMGGGELEESEKYMNRIDRIVNKECRILSKELNKLERYSFSETDENEEATKPLSKEEYEKFKGKKEGEKKDNPNPFHIEDKKKSETEKKDIYNSLDWNDFDNEENIKFVTDSLNEYYKKEEGKPLNDVEKVHMFSKGRVAKFPNGSFLVEYYTPKHKDDMTGSRGLLVRSKEDIGGYQKYPSYHLFWKTPDGKESSISFSGKSNAVSYIKSILKNRNYVR